jgi:protein SCO1/2
MKFDFHTVICAVSLYLLTGCGSGVLSDREVRGKVSAIHPENLMIQLDVRKGPYKGKDGNRYKVTDGDIKWLTPGREIRGIVLDKEGTLHLEQIFPASNKEESLMYVRNQNLRNNTVDRGEQVFREVGETLPHFALFDQDGNIWDQDSLKGKRTVIAFIFTRCRAPEMCPATTMRMGKLLHQIKKENLKTTQLISITMDPEYDTPGILKSYAGGFGVDDPQFRFLTGTLQATHDLKKQLGIMTNPDPAMLIQHTMSTILVGPDLKIIHRVPGSQWDEQDFLEKIRSIGKPSVIPTNP